MEPVVTSLVASQWFLFGEINHPSASVYISLVKTPICYTQFGIYI